MSFCQFSNLKYLTSSERHLRHMTVLCYRYKCECGTQGTVRSIIIRWNALLMRRNHVRNWYKRRYKREETREEMILSRWGGANKKLLRYVLVQVFLALVANVCKTPVMQLFLLKITSSLNTKFWPFRHPQPNFLPKHKLNLTSRILKFRTANPCCLAHNGRLWEAEPSFAPSAFVWYLYVYRRDVYRRPKYWSLPGAQTCLGQALRINRKGWCCATPFQRQKLTKNSTK